MTHDQPDQNQSDNKGINAPTDHEPSFLAKLAAAFLGSLLSLLALVAVGAIVGAIAGFFTAGPIGAIIGAVLGIAAVAFGFIAYMSDPF